MEDPTIGGRGNGVRLWLKDPVGVEGMKTTEGPMKTTEGPMNTTEGPMKTTEGPMKISEAPMKITEGPMKTTEGPMKTTEGQALFGRPWPTHPPTHTPHIRSTFLRQKMKFIKGVGNLRTFFVTQTFFWPLTHPREEGGVLPKK